MQRKAISIAAYLVRTSGLLIIGAMSAVVAFQPLFSRNGNSAAIVGGLWALAAVVLSWPRLPDAWRRDPPTERQIEYASSLGIAIPPGASKGELSEMISRATGR